MKKWVGGGGGGGEPVSSETTHTDKYRERCGQQRF